MQLTIVHLAAFVTNWQRLRLNDDDLRALEWLLLEDPERGQVMTGTGGLGKLRFAPPSRHTGKSGATRVGYAYFRAADTVYLVVIYAKNEAANLTPGERKQIKSLLDRIRRSLEKGN